MDSTQGGERSLWSRPYMWQAALTLLIIVSIFFLAKTYNEVKGSSYIGKDNSLQNTITVSGTGESISKPDIAEISLTSQEEGATVTIAQGKVTEKINSTIKFLKDSGIEDKDIKNVGYNVYPKYEYPQVICSYGSCPAPKQRLVGYEVSQSLSIKVRDVAKAGDILSGIGSIGINNVSGLNFTIDDEDTLIADAREKAIDDAKAKAKILADDLGVKLVRIAHFEESGNYPIPTYYKLENQARDMVSNGGGAPQVPTGENTITSNVTITYEIR